MRLLCVMSQRGRHRAAQGLLTPLTRPRPGLCWAPSPSSWGQRGPVLGPHCWAHSQVALTSVLIIILTQETYLQLPAVSAWCWCSSSATSAPPLPVITHWSNWSGVCWPWVYLGSAGVLHHRGVKFPVRYRHKTTFSRLFTQPRHTSQLQAQQVQYQNKNSTAILVISLKVKMCI